MDHAHRENALAQIYTSVAIEALAQQRFRQAEDALKAQEGYADQGFVFADMFGRPLQRNAFANAFRKIKKIVGVTKRLHGPALICSRPASMCGRSRRCSATPLRRQP
jgi:hypothetical protein